MVSIDDNSIGQMRREQAEGFAVFMDNPVSVGSTDTETGDLGFLVAPMVAMILHVADAEEFRLLVWREGIFRVVNNVSRQIIEVPARQGTYQWAEHRLSQEAINS